jgi:hypothetical protein
VQNILYPEKVWTESAAFDTSFAASVALAADPRSRLSLVRQPFGQSISAAPADPSPRLSSLMKRGDLQYERNLQVIASKLA